jgi:hypothetical protein
MIPMEVERIINGENYKCRGAAWRGDGMMARWG